LNAALAQIVYSLEIIACERAFPGIAAWNGFNKTIVRDEVNPEVAKIDLACQVCGRIVQPEADSWKEDDGGGRYCRFCMAERESCGCSE
jgi:hypothetical protein